jgi:putative flippase GtrA
MTDPAWFRQFMRFAQVGALCAVLHFFLLAIGVEWLGLGAVAASTLGYSLSAAANYMLNRRYTYANDAPHAVLVWRFVTVLAIGLILNSLLMQLLHGYLRWHYVLAQLMTTAGTLLWNFCAHRYWTFSRSETCG